MNEIEGLARILPANARIFVIGVGNEHRSDDAVGLVVARGLRKLLPDNVTVIEETGEGANLMESWKGADMVILIDAATSGARPGTIHRIDAQAEQVPRGLFHYSTHTFSVGEAVELARTMNRLPAHFVLYGIEGESYEEGVTLSQVMEESVDRVVSLVLKDIQGERST